MTLGWNAIWTRRATNTRREVVCGGRKAASTAEGVDGHPNSYYVCLKYTPIPTEQEWTIPFCIPKGEQMHTRQLLVRFVG